VCVDADRHCCRCVIELGSIVHGDDCAMCHVSHSPRLCVLELVLRRCLHLLYLPWSFLFPDVSNAAAREFLLTIELNMTVCAPSSYRVFELGLWLRHLWTVFERLTILWPLRFFYEDSC